MNCFDDFPNAGVRAIWRCELSSELTLLRKAILDLCERTTIILQSSRPRGVSLPFQRAPVLTCTGGAFKGTIASWGAIVLDAWKGTRLCFYGLVLGCLIHAWRFLVGEQLICQIERYSVVCVRWAVRSLLHKRRAVFFTDNELYGYALLKDRLPSDPLFSMSHACACTEAMLPCYVWYVRIASACNPADLLSRMRWQEA